ncbi:hypothetical protein JOM56_002740 [Amanita muscaria]
MLDALLSSADKLAMQKGSSCPGAEGFALGTIHGRPEVYTSVWLTVIGSLVTGPRHTPPLQLVLLIDVAVSVLMLLKRDSRSPEERCAKNKKMESSPSTLSLLLLRTVPTSSFDVAASFNEDVGTFANMGQQAGVDPLLLDTLLKPSSLPIMDSKTPFKKLVPMPLDPWHSYHLRRWHQGYIRPPPRDSLMTASVLQAHLGNLADTGPPHQFCPTKPKLLHGRARMLRSQSGKKRSLANKKASLAVTLTKQQQAFVQAQLEKEATMRQLAFSDKANHEPHPKSSCFTGVERFCSDISSHFWSLGCSAVVRGWLAEPRSGLIRLDTFQWIGVATFRALHVSAMPGLLNNESCGSSQYLFSLFCATGLTIRCASLSVLPGLRNITFDDPTFSYGYP